VKLNLYVLFILAAGTFIIYRNSFSIFFTQDDFIMIYQFSRNNLTVDIGNAIGFPQVTHWRPLDNLYFLTAGNLLDKNFYAYHFLTFAFHLGVTFLIFKIVKEITMNIKMAFVVSFIYAIHPAHFVTLFWISGSATTIGFLFLLLSFFLYLLKRGSFALICFILALFSSEAMIAGLGLFVLHRYLIKKETIMNGFMLSLLITSGIFAIVKFLFLTPQATYEAYQIKIWPQMLINTKYYLLRIAGFAETSGDVMVSMILLGLLSFTSFRLLQRLKAEKEHKIFVFGFVIILLGLFPFVLISNLSPHYMNISIFGFAILIGVSVSELTIPKTLTFLGILFFVFYVNVNEIYKNNWVVQRSNLALNYISKIEAANLPQNSTIVFDDNYISTSQEAYFALGNGKALDFWFKGKNYKSCFTWFENCESVQ